MFLFKSHFFWRLISRGCALCFAVVFLRTYQFEIVRLAVMIRNVVCCGMCLENMSWGNKNVKRLEGDLIKLGNLYVL